MKLYDGGAAFPRPMVVAEGITEGDEQDGMTLRDWFAGHALAGMLAYSPADTDGPCETLSYGEAASNAYKYADAMLKTRDPKPPAKPDAGD